MVVAAETPSRPATGVRTILASSEGKGATHNIAPAMRLKTAGMDRVERLMMGVYQTISVSLDDP
jgi:hypothetical protein